jgi:hypothetical protein
VSRFGRRLLETIMLVSGYAAAGLRVLGRLKTLGEIARAPTRRMRRQVEISGTLFNKDAQLGYRHLIEYQQPSQGQPAGLTGPGDIETQRDVSECL